MKTFTEKEVLELFAGFEGYVNKHSLQEFDYKTFLKEKKITGKQVEKDYKELLMNIPDCIYSEETVKDIGYMDFIVKIMTPTDFFSHRLRLTGSQMKEDFSKEDKEETRKSLIEFSLKSFVLCLSGTPLTI